MKKHSFDAICLLYISIFIEQSMDKESFTIEEEIEITYVTYYSLLASYAYSKSQESKAEALTFIKQNYPHDIEDIIVETLEDMITLYPEMENFAIEAESFTKLGSLLLQKNIPILEQASFELKEEDIDEFFSYTMYLYEALLLLDEYEHNFQKVIEDLDDLELDPSIVEIINCLKT
ncbi:MAG: hypothetical protein ACRCTJ_05080 [Brevinema sp.]